VLGRLGMTTTVCEVQAFRSEQVQHTLLHTPSRQSWRPQWGRRSCLGSTLQETAKAYCLALYLHGSFTEYGCSLTRTCAVPNFQLVLLGVCLEVGLTGVDSMKA